MTLLDWENLRRFVNNQPVLFGTVGVRDPDNVCEVFDGKNYDGTGDCLSDGHYLCKECSHLSPRAPRFEEYGAQGRADRLLLYWARRR
jgi:hypothetical protein